MVSWDKICHPKKLGGLGLRKMEAVNSAFMSKLTWKLFHDKSLWVAQMQAKYSLSEDFFTLKARSSDSWVWKCLLNNRTQFRNGIQWKVGDGKTIRFWIDNWCAQDNLANMLHSQDVSILDTSLLVSHFISPTKEWDLAKLRQYVDEDILKLILATPIPFNPIPDSVCWGLSGNGLFSTKSATWAAHFFIWLILLHGRFAGFGTWILCLNWNSFYGNCVMLRFRLGALF